MNRLLDAQIECFDKAIALLPNPERRVLLKSEGEEGWSADERSDALGAITFLEMIARLLTIKPLRIIV
jgi:DNA-directed RNA polymerase specialized sigma24 family protein